jgi:hypothetical protein
MRKIVRTYVDREVGDLREVLGELMTSTADYPLLFEHSFVIMPLPGRLHNREEGEANHRLAKELAYLWRWPYRKKVVEKEQKPNQLLLVGVRLSETKELRHLIKQVREDGATKVWGLTLV